MILYSFYTDFLFVEKLVTIAIHNAAHLALKQN